MGTIAESQNQVNMTINQEAPVIQTKEIIINAQPEKIWQVLTNIKKWGDWNSRITNLVTQSELKVGSTFTWKTKGSKIKSTVHTFKTNQVLGWIGKTFGAKAIHNWYLEPTSNGIKVRVEESMEGWIIGLIHKKMNRILEEDMRFWLEQLKTESER